MAASRKPPAKPAAMPDQLIMAGKEGRIRLIENRKPRRPAGKPTGKTARKPAGKLKAR